MSKKSQAVAQSAEAITARELLIEQPRIAAVAFEIVGTSTLIQNAFSQKAIEEMLKKHMGISVQREKKNPRQVIERAIVRNEDGMVCMPVVAVKLAMLTAAKAIKTFDRKGTQLRTGLFIEGGSLPIKFDKMIPRMDMVRTSGMSATPDVRFRPEFTGWSARVIIQYSDSLLQPQSVADLLQRAGSVGIGEWRPENNGTHGCFRLARQIDSAKELAEVRAACAVAVKGPQIPEWALDMDIDFSTLGKMFDGAHEDEQDEPKKNKTAG